MNTGAAPASTTPEHPPLPPGITPLEPSDPPQIGPYPLVGRIGAGGMGAVYGALDVYGRCVAVKVVHADLVGQSGFREAFAREVSMLERAQGVSTARLHAHDTDAEVPWLAFDFVPGRDLRTHVREFGPLSGAMLRVFALGMAEGLATLHAAGVAHRDIKPGNVILSPQGPKIVDFGIAVEIGTQRSQDAAASYGTPGWAAPERHDGAAADPSADVFAWGGLVALAATGREPFGTGETRERIRRVRSGEYEVDGVPDDLRGLVESALAVGPAERPDAETLVRVLLPEDENRTHGTAEILRRMLGAYWRGVDDAGHDPARWAGALAAVSTVGLGSSALSGGVGGAAGVSGLAAGGSSAAVAGAFGGTFTGGVMGGLAGSKLAMVGAGVLAIASLATGAYVVYGQVSTSPEEWVTAAAQTLEEGAGFTATVERVPVDGGEAINEEYLYSATDQSFLILGEAMGQGATAVADHQGELYVYVSRTQDISGGAWHDSVKPMTPHESVTAAGVSSGLVTDPLRGLADSGDVERGEEGGVFTGPTTLSLLSEGALVEEEVVGRVEVDDDGAPVQVDYTGEDWDVHVEFIAIDVEVVVEDPQVSSIGEGAGWAAVHAPMCGRVSMGGREWDVQASAWEMDCARAMDVSEMMNNSESFGQESDSERAEVMAGYSGSGGSTWLVDGVMACSIFRRDLGGDIENRTFFLSPCRPAAPQGETTEEWPFVELEFEARTLIDYHDRS